MSTISAARTALRSAASRSCRSATTTTKIFSTSNPKMVSCKHPLSARIFRSPVEMSCAVQSILPYHTAKASALLISMLSVAPRCYGWIIDDK